MKKKVVAQKVFKKGVVIDDLNHFVDTVIVSNHIEALKQTIYDDGSQSVSVVVNFNPEKIGLNRYGVNLIANERKRQVEKEGYSLEHDDMYVNGELSKAASCYATPKRGHVVPSEWPWGDEWWKPRKEDTIDGRIDELKKAGALIAAEIDRLNRQRTEYPKY